MKETKYTGGFLLLGNDIDGQWIGEQEVTFESREELVQYLRGGKFMDDFNRSRGEFDMAVYRIPKGGINIYKRYGYHKSAAKKHQVFEASYMTSDKFTSQHEADAGECGTMFIFRGPQDPPLEFTVPL